MNDKIRIDPGSSALHYKAAAEFWENRAHLMQDALVKSQLLVDKLQERVAELESSGEILKED